MHIKEVDEHLDYNNFWTFPPEVTDITKAAGNRFWDTIQGLADTYPCPPCKPGAKALAHGGHDVVNLLLGKEAKTPKELENLFYMVDEAKKLYKKGHKCIGSTCGKVEPTKLYDTGARHHHG